MTEKLRHAPGTRPDYPITRCAVQGVRYNNSATTAKLVHRQRAHIDVMSCAVAGSSRESGAKADRNWHPHTRRTLCRSSESQYPLRIPNSITSNYEAKLSCVDRIGSPHYVHSMGKRQCTHAKQPGYLLELVAVLDDPAALSSWSCVASPYPMVGVATSALTTAVAPIVQLIAVPV